MVVLVIGSHIKTRKPHLELVTYKWTAVLGAGGERRGGIRGSTIYNCSIPVSSPI